MGRTRGRPVCGWGMMETRQAKINVFRMKNYVMDPHGAIGYLGLKKYQEETQTPVSGIFLETAHPAKFMDVVEGVLQQPIAIPPTLQKFMKGKKQSIALGNGFEEFKTFLMK